MANQDRSSESVAWSYALGAPAGLAVGTALGTFAALNPAVAVVGASTVGLIAITPLAAKMGYNLADKRQKAEDLSRIFPIAAHARADAARLEAREAILFAASTAGALLVGTVAGAGPSASVLQHACHFTMDLAAAAPAIGIMAREAESMLHGVGDKGRALANRAFKSPVARLSRIVAVGALACAVAATGIAAAQYYTTPPLQSDITTLAQLDGRGVPEAVSRTADRNLDAAAAKHPGLAVAAAFLALNDNAIAREDGRGILSKTSERQLANVIIKALPASVQTKLPDPDAAVLERVEVDPAFALVKVTRQGTPLRAQALASINQASDILYQRGLKSASVQDMSQSSFLLYTAGLGMSAQDQSRQPVAQKLLDRATAMQTGNTSNTDMAFQKGLMLQMSTVIGKGTPVEGQANAAYSAWSEGPQAAQVAYTQIIAGAGYDVTIRDAADQRSRDLQVAFGGKSVVPRFEMPHG